MIRRGNRRVWVGQAALGTVVGLAVAVMFPGVGMANNYVGGAWHWSDGSNPRAWMTIVDHTSSSWPVLAATSEWATEPDIDMYYSYGTCGGSEGRCVDVRVINMAPRCTGPPGSGYSGGYFDPVAFSNDHYTQQAIIRFNNDCNGGSYTNRDRRALACEEIGHSIGLDHANPDLNDVTCMASEKITQLHEHPRPHDFTTLDEDIYNHSDP